MDYKTEKKIKQSFREMCNLQDRLNKVIDNNWLINRTTNDFKIAIHQEVAELIDTYNWKWWKYMEEDELNRKIELVDIWHFIMSYLILKYKAAGVRGFINAAADYFFDAYKHTPKMKPRTTKDEINKILEFNSEMIKDNYLVSIPIFFSIVKYYMDIEEFIKLYFAKNALNMIRQELGYKEGTYKKVLDRMKEDNYFIFDIIKDIDAYNEFDKFYEELKTKIIEMQ